MAMTAAVKDELSRVIVSKGTARRAEIATLLRFAGALHLVAGHIVIEAELDTGSVARRLRHDVGEVFGHGSDVHESVVCAVGRVGAPASAHGLAGRKLTGGVPHAPGVAKPFRRRRM